MDRFFIFVFFVFFVVPILKNIFGGKAKKGRKPKKTQAYERMQRKINQYGHSGAKQRTHKQMHNRDNSAVFPKEHQAHVRARDARDRQKNKVIEKALHSRKNEGIIRAGNKSREDWGTRGGGGLGIGGLAFLLILGGAAFALVSRLSPEILNHGWWR